MNTDFADKSETPFTDGIRKALGRDKSNGTTKTLPHFEETKIYIDSYSKRIASGSFWNAMFADASNNTPDLVDVLAANIQLANEEQAAVYRLGVIHSIEASRVEFQKRLAELTGENITVRVMIHSRLDEPCPYFDALAGSGLSLSQANGCQWFSLTDAVRTGDTAVFGPTLAEAGE